MKSIREVLPPVYRQGADSSSADEELVLSYWAPTVGPGIARFARAHRLFGKTLVVVVESEQWQRQLTGLKRRIALQLNRALGGKLVGDIRFRLPRPEKTSLQSVLRAKPFSAAAGGASPLKDRKKSRADRPSKRQTAKRGKRK